MQLRLDEIEEYIKIKGYSDYIANKVGMIELYDDKLTLTDTDIALENLFINTGINKDTTLNEAIDIGIVAEHLLKKKENMPIGIPIDNTGIPSNEVGRPPMDSEVYQKDKEVYLDNSEVYLTRNINILSTKVDDLLRDRTKNLAKKLKISVSVLIRNMLIEKIDE